MNIVFFWLPEKDIDPFLCPDKYFAGMWFQLETNKPTLPWGRLTLRTMDNKFLVLTQSLKKLVKNKRSNQDNFSKKSRIAKNRSKAKKKVRIPFFFFPEVLSKDAGGCFTSHMCLGAAAFQ